VPYDVLVVGDVNVDIVIGGMAVLPALGTEELGEEFDFRGGGSSGNCAVALARIGVRTAFMGLLGKDPFGDFLVDNMRTLGVGTEYIRRTDRVKSGVTVSLSLAHDRAFATYLGTLGALCYDDLELGALAHARHLHLGSYYLLQGMRGSYCRLFEQAKRAGLSTSLDLGWDPAQKWNGELPELLRWVDVFLPNQEEAMHVTDAPDPLAALAILADQVPVAVVKMGAQGAAAAQGRQSWQQPAWPVAVKDTTALGDCFNAGFLRAWLGGEAVPQALAWGTAAAAIAASRMGDDRYPTAAEVSTLIGGEAR